ncbi:MAG: hypothetical protein FWB97_00985 [Oscillospiraceae bacterium]|nr:hypothetical protein [Oscillospiraceae bacterium]
MHEDLIKWFFNENGLDSDGTPPAAAIEHFQIKLFLNDSPLPDVLDDTIRKKLPGRSRAVMEESADIEAATSGAQIIKFMRRGTDMLNQQSLLHRALEFEDEIVPEILRMLKTSLNDLFVEMSARVFAICTQDISEDLIGIYDDVRSANAKSMILLALGFKAPEGAIPWIVKKYSELKSAYPNKPYCYGAYYALFEMESRFYSKSSKFSVPHSGT